MKLLSALLLVLALAGCYPPPLDVTDAVVRHAEEACLRYGQRLAKIDRLEKESYRNAFEYWGTCNKGARVYAIGNAKDGVLAVRKSLVIRVDRWAL